MQKFCLPRDIEQWQGLHLTVKIGKRVGLGYCHSVGGGQECWEILHSAQDSLPTTKSINSTMKITLNQNKVNQNQNTVQNYQPVISGL